METLAVKSVRSGRSNPTIRETDSEVERKIATFDVGDEVWIAKGKAFGIAMTRAFETNCYGPGTITKARHPRYALRTAGNKVTQEAIHVRRLRLFHRRPGHLLS